MTVGCYGFEGYWELFYTVKTYYSTFLFASSCSSHRHCLNLENILGHLHQSPTFPVLRLSALRPAKFEITTPLGMVVVVMASESLVTCCLCAY